MIDAADLAILETHLDVMNPVERQLLEEVRRLFDEASDVAELEGKISELEEELSSARYDNVENQEEIERLTAKVEKLEEEAQGIARERDCAESALAEMKDTIRELVA